VTTGNVQLPAARRPGRLATLRELSAPLDWATLLLRAPSLRRAPRGDGRPVMLLPGYGADASSMRPLGRYLAWLGYEVVDWGIGRNRGHVNHYVGLVGARAREMHDRPGGEPLTLIGWSLGGVIARETARLFEPCVREVITLGTPIIGGPKYTAMAEGYAKRGGIDLDEFEKEVHARNLLGIRQPVTSIFSKRDGIVGWRASVDVYNRHARNIEVSASHFGLGANGEVWRIIAEILAPPRVDPAA